MIESNGRSEEVRADNTGSPGLHGYVHRRHARPLGWLVAVLALSISVLHGPADAAPQAAVRDGRGAPSHPPAQSRGGIRITLLQMGDVHGHLIPRPNLRSDGTGLEEGGLSRLYARIAQIRAEQRNVLLFNTGDTIQGGAEVLYTRGQAIIDILDRFGIDGMANGNWDFLYGKERFLELFGPGTGAGPSGTRYGAVAANVYHEGTDDLLLPPYFVKNVNGIKIGVLGLSSERAINALGPFITAGIAFTADAQEVPRYVDILRNREKVDLIVLLSEFGLAKNVLIANDNPDIDVVLSSDMHEETPRAVVAASGAIVSEAGQDGTQLAQLDLVFHPGKRLESWDYTWHTITTAIAPDPDIEALVNAERSAFIAGPAFMPHVNPLNGMLLTTPIDSTVGYAEIGLYRGNFSQELLPGAIEGSSHDFLADALRDQAGADIAHFRGFRYGTHVAPGPIQLEDLYHYIAVGPQIATTTITGAQLKNNIENSANGSLNPDIFAWTGGWLNAYGGVRMDLDPYAAAGSRVTNIMIQDAETGVWAPLDPAAEYTWAGYWYEQDPQIVGGIRTDGPITVVRGPENEVLDGTEVVSNYLATHTANPQLGRVNLLAPLPPPVYGNPEIQPLLGVPPVPSE